MTTNFPRNAARAAYDIWVSEGPRELCAAELAWARHIAESLGRATHARLIDADLRKAVGAALSVLTVQ